MNLERTRPLSISPRDAQEAVDVLRACTRLRSEGRKVRAGIVESPFRPAVNIVISGINSTKDDVESLNASDEVLVLLSRGRMDQIREISSLDFLAVVDGGVTFGSFVDEVKKAGLFFPHEPDYLPRDATIAEIIMDGTPFRTDGRFGALREFVLSLELAIPKGEMIRTGSRSVKDVAGYNVAGFLMGLGGLCGFIAKATLRLLPAPPRRVRFAAFGSAEELEVFAEKVHRAMSPLFLELFEGSAARALGGRLGESRGAGALLLGEVFWAGLGAEDKALQKLLSLSPAHISISLFGGSPFGESEGIMHIAFEVLDKGCGVYHYLIDGDARSPDMEDAFLWRSFYPRRLHIIAARDSDGKNPIEARNGVIGGQTLSALGNLLAETYGAGLQNRIELIERAGDALSRRRIHGHEIRNALAGAGCSAAVRERFKQEELLDRLAARVLESFDPQGIMIP